MGKKVIFELSAYEDFKNWEQRDSRFYRQIINIIKQITISDSTIVNASEKLARELQGYTSTKLDREHRLVYKLTDTAIFIIACKYDW